MPHRGFRTGTSDLLIGLGPAGAEKGFRVMYTLASRLVSELVEAENDKALAKAFARYDRVDLLCIIDELALPGPHRTRREGLGGNESFSGWTKTFTNPRLCGAIVDRLTFNGTIIETGTDSYRLANTLAQQAAS